MGKSKRLLTILVMLIFIMLTGCNSNNSGDKFIGKWEEISESKTVVNIEYIDKSHKTIKITSDKEPTVTGTLENGIVKLDLYGGGLTLFINNDKNLEIAGADRKIIYKQIK